MEGEIFAIFERKVNCEEFVTNYLFSSIFIYRSVQFLVCLNDISYLISRVIVTGCAWNVI